RQILADVLQTEIVTINTAEGAAYGAALLAAVGAGAFTSVPEACRQVIQVTGRTTVGADTAVYDQLYPLYRRLYPAQQSIFAALAHI
ncbi:MAG: xylulokinase, partial [Anaerolineales bacterium]|nr:xylulokinase [Anaerolineales bacterium]